MIHGDDIRKENQAETQFASHFNLLRKEQQRWEDDPNRKEPWEPAHQRNLDDYVANNLLPPDSLEAAISDWFCVGLYTGIRKSEWAQPNNSHWEPHRFQHEDRFTPLPRAFCRQDISFTTEQKKRLIIEDLLNKMSENEAVAMIGQLIITWRTQKNAHRNQKIKFTRNMKHPNLCCIRRILRILKRHQRLSKELGRTTLNSTPLSIYRHSNGSIRNIVTKNIETVMRNTIARWADLDPNNPKDAAVLKDWASHSLRVGATNVLFAAGFTGHQIQIILRWDSLAFMDYFRNLAIIGDKQNNALTLDTDDNNVHIMPNLI